MKAYSFIFSFMTIGILASCGGNPNSDVEQTDVQEELQIIENIEMHKQVGYLKFDSAELVALAPDLQHLYVSIVQNTNYASGISIASIMEEVNTNLNRLMESDTGAVYEKELIDAMNLMKGNQRMASQNFNQAGRWLLRKFYEYQTANYPSLSGQVGTLKSHLGEVDARDRLTGQEKKVRAFIDQCFVLLYLIEEEKSKEELEG